MIFTFQNYRLKILSQCQLSPTTTQLVLNLRLEDSKYNLDRINIWVNDVAIYGTGGISLKDKFTQTFNATILVPLAFGKNKIQASVLNAVGAESYKETVMLECTAGKQKPDLYMLSIGVSKYRDSRYNLSYASKDAFDLNAAFSNGKFFNQVHSKTLTDEQVTLENISLVKEFFANADINDQVIIFVAGHGVLDKNFDYYLLHTTWISKFRLLEVFHMKC
ncbi:MAG: hypothetical protein IPM77_15080 [Crocinitomicaceae bacterium]|nr:hypothetical protein [Crocinitomicaceae bacterium]